MKVILGVLAISTIVLMLIRNRLTTLTKIKKVAAIYRILIYFAIGAMFFYPNLIQSICAIVAIAGIQIGVIVDARERFFDYMVSHGDEWCFVPTVKVDKGHYEGYLILSDEESEAIKATCFCQNEDDELKINVMYTNAPVYISMNFAGYPKDVFCTL